MYVFPPLTLVLLGLKSKYKPRMKAEYKFSGNAITKLHKLGGLNNKDLFLCGSGCLVSKIRVFSEAAGSSLGTSVNLVSLYLAMRALHIRLVPGLRLFVSLIIFIRILAPGIALMGGTEGWDFDPQTVGRYSSALTSVAGKRGPGISFPGCCACLRALDSVTRQSIIWGFYLVCGMLPRPSQLI